jgi:hypothetical protein
VNLWEVAIVAAICAVGVFLFVFTRKWIAARPQITPPCEMDKAGLIRWLGSYRDWYTTSAWLCDRISTLCRIVPIISGFAIALLSALREQEPPPWNEYVNYNVMIIALSGLSTLSVAIITQLGIAELAKAREIGRIECARLLSLAQILLSKHDSSEEDLYKAKLTIHQEIFRVEHDQAALYAAIVAGQTLSDRSGARAEKTPP